MLSISRIPKSVGQYTPPVNYHIYHVLSPPFVDHFGDQIMAILPFGLLNRLVALLERNGIVDVVASKDVIEVRLIFCMVKMKTVKIVVEKHEYM